MLISFSHCSLVTLDLRHTLIPAYLRGEVTTGGHRAHKELDHINCFELKATLLR